MKYLKNTTTGQLIEITKVLRSEETAAINIYDNGIDFKNGKILKSELIPLDTAVIPDVPMTLSDTLWYIAVQTVEALNPGFVETADTVNWSITVGSTALQTTVRIQVPFFTIGKRIYTGEPIDVLLQAMSYLTPWTTRGNDSVVQYLEELLPEHKLILEAYAEDGVIIDYKE